MDERKAPAEFELLLKDWAGWKLDGCTGTGSYPSEAPYARNMGGGQRDYVPDVDRSLRCSAVQEAIDTVGGIHEGVLRAYYISPRGIGGIEKKYAVSRRTAYRWLDDATLMVWRAYLVREENNRVRKSA